MRTGFFLAALVPLAACKPPPTDADIVRDMPSGEATFASAPLDSPDTEDAVWARSATEGRLVYGTPGEPPLIALACIENETLRITRHSPADEGAGALLALVGNGHIGRLEVDATEVNSRSVWQGELAAEDMAWEPLTGPRVVTATVPGAGMVTLNASDMPGELIGDCRESGSKETPPPAR